MLERPKLQALKAAFPTTIPILWAFSFLGIGAGLYATSIGLSPHIPVIMSIVIFTGTLEFIVASMLVAPFSPLLVLAISLLVSARHIFYSISMLDKYRGQGKKAFYLIFALCDETFSLNAGTKVPKGIDAGWYYFFITLLNQLYWVLGVTIGSYFKNIVPINTTGVEFVMCAMFVVIVIERFLSEKDHTASLLGLGISAVALAFFGSQNFLPVALVGMLLSLSLLRQHLEPTDNAEASHD